MKRWGRGNLNHLRLYVCRLELLRQTDRQTAAGYLQSYRLQRVPVGLYRNLELGYTEKKNI